MRQVKHFGTVTISVPQSFIERSLKPGKAPEVKPVFSLHGTADKDRLKSHSLLLLLYLLTTLLFTTVDFSHRKIGSFSSWKASCYTVALPNLRCMLGCSSVSILYLTLTWNTGSLTCVRDLFACVYTRDLSLLSHQDCRGV